MLVEEKKEQQLAAARLTISKRKAPFAWTPNLDKCLIFAFLEAKTSKECVDPVNFSIKDWKSFVSKYWNKENSRLPKLDGDSTKDDDRLDRQEKEAAKRQDAIKIQYAWRKIVKKKKAKASMNEDEARTEQGNGSGVGRKKRKAADAVAVYNVFQNPPGCINGVCRKEDTMNWKIFF